MGHRDTLLCDTTYRNATTARSAPTRNRPPLSKRLRSSLSAVSGSPVFDGWSRHALCGRFGYSDLKEASVRGPMYFVSDSGDSDGGLGWRYGSGESIAAMGCAELDGLEAVRWGC